MVLSVASNLMPNNDFVDIVELVPITSEMKESHAAEVEQVKSDMLVVAKHLRVNS